jgi:hypothetical protein
VQHPHQLLQADIAAAAGQLQYDRELIATEPADGRAWACPGGEPGRDRHEHGIPGRVAHRVVHGLEMVFPD